MNFKTLTNILWQAIGQNPLENGYGLRPNQATPTPLNQRETTEATTPKPIVNEIKDVEVEEINSPLIQRDLTTNNETFIEDSTPDNLTTLLPKEILMHIFSYAGYTDKTDLLTLRLINQFFKANIINFPNFKLYFPIKEIIIFDKKSIKFQEKKVITQFEEKNFTCLQESFTHSFSPETLGFSISPEICNASELHFTDIGNSKNQNTATIEISGDCFNLTKIHCEHIYENATLQLNGNFSSLNEISCPSNRGKIQVTENSTCPNLKTLNISNYSNQGSLSLPQNFTNELHYTSAINYGVYSSPLLSHPQLNITSLSCKPIRSANDYFNHSYPKLKSLVCNNARNNELYLNGDSFPNLKSFTFNSGGYDNDKLILTGTFSELETMIIFTNYEAEGFSIDCNCPKLKYMKIQFHSPNQSYTSTIKGQFPLFEKLELEDLGYTKTFNLSFNGTFPMLKQMHIKSKSSETATQTLTLKDNIPYTFKFEKVQWDL